VRAAPAACATGLTPSPRTPAQPLAAGPFGVSDLDERVTLEALRFLRAYVLGGLIGQLAFELAPLLLGPPQFLGGGREIEEMDRNYRGPGTEIGVSDQGVELTTSLRESGMDVVQPLLLRLGVGVSTGGSQACSSWGWYVMVSAVSRAFVLRFAIVLERTAILPRTRSRAYIACA
jgi:hypothetical protein